MKIHFEIISLYWVEWLFCEALIVWHLVGRVCKKRKKIDSGKTRLLCNTSNKMDIMLCGKDKSGNGHFVWGHLDLLKDALTPVIVNTSFLLPTAQKSIKLLSYYVML